MFPNVRGGVTRNLFVVVALIIAAISSGNGRTFDADDEAADRPGRLRDHSVHAVIPQGPLMFTRNMGQWNEQVLFRTDVGWAIVWITTDGVTYRLTRRVEHAPLASDAPRRPTPKEKAVLQHMTADDAKGFRQDRLEQLVIRVSLAGSNPAPDVTGMDELDYKCNYFMGDDPTRWLTDVPSYSAVVVREIYPGIDLSYGSDEEGQLKCEFHVAANADMSQIQIRYAGEGSLLVSDSGDLSLETAWTRMNVQAPSLIRQTAQGQHRSQTRYAQLSADRVGVVSVSNVGARSTSFVVPPRAFITSLGGSSRDGASAVTVDALGEVYVTGYTQSADFPTEDPIQETYHGGGYYQRDAFVMKLAADGSHPIYSTYLGGNQDDEGYAIAVDASGSAHVTGYTRSGDFPVVNPCCGGTTYSQACFIAKLSREGNQLSFSTLLGAYYGHAIAVDLQGAVYVTGSAPAGALPIVNAFQSEYQGGIADAFVTKIDGSGGPIIYSTYLGGDLQDVGFGIAVDPSGAAFVTGYTSSKDFPLVNPYEIIFQGGEMDAFVSKFSSTGESLLFSTYLGGSYDEVGTNLGIDSLGSAYVAGWTQSKDFPTANPFQRTHQAGPNVYGDYDGFVTKFPAMGGRPVYSTYLGGSGWDIPLAIAVDGAGSACIAGYTGSINFPTAFANQSDKGGQNDAMVARLSPSGNALIFGSYLGGTSWDEGHGIAIVDDRSVLIAGVSGSADFPFSNPCQGCRGGSDVFVARLNPSLHGDANNDGQITIDDVIYLANYLFERGPVVVPTLASGDADCDDQITLMDIVYMINYMFRGGPAPC